MRRSTAMAAAAVCVLAGACTPIDDALAAVPFFKFMRKTQVVGTYADPRPAPANAVPFESPGGRPEPAVAPTQASLDAFAASPYGRNPLAPGEALELGRTKFEQYCMVCHGAEGEGNGPVVGPGKFPMGPALVGETGRGTDRTDGHIYAVVKAGISLMPPYGGRTTVHERWAIVNYVRELQRAAGAAPPPAADTAAAAPDTAAAAEPGDTAATDTASDTTASEPASSR